MLFNGRDAEPPPHPGRVQMFLMGCGALAHEYEVEFAGGKIQRKRMG